MRTCRRPFRAVLADKLLAKADVGIEIERLGDSASADELIYQQNAALPLTPASNLKLVTTSATLDKLGSGFKFRTLLASTIRI